MEKDITRKWKLKESQNTILKSDKIDFKIKTVKNPQTINAEQGVERREPVGGNVNWCSHYGEQFGGSLRN